MKRVFGIFIIGAGLLACSSVNTLEVSAKTVGVREDVTSNQTMDSIISPYNDSLRTEMNEVIAASDVNFIIQRPSSNLMNWVADAIFVNQTKNVRLGEPTFCLLNTGGIRSVLNKGEITLGDMYKLMPFDNEIVWVKLPSSVIPDIEEYLTKSGGEPLSGARLVQGKLEINGWRKDAQYIWVITSDYLMNGGDKMSFFGKKEDVMLTGHLMRDALITEAKEQQLLVEDTTVRISF